MRFAGAFLILALGAGPAASGQEAADREQRISELQKQLDAIAAQLRALQSETATGQGSLDTRLDGAVRESPSEALREPRRLNISAPGIDSLDISGGLHTRGEYWGNYETGAGNGDGLAFGTEAWLGFNAKISEKSNVFIEPQASFVWGDDTTHNLTAGPPGTAGSFVNSDDVQIVQAYLHVGDMYGSGWDMTVGRHENEFGAERMIGDDEWNLNRTTFDGFRFDRDLGDPGTLSVLLLRIEDVVHSSAFLAPTAPHQTPRGDLYGLYYTSKPSDTAGQFDIYVLHLEDPNWGGVNDDNTRWTTYGGRWASPSFAGLVLDVEAATQFGEILGVDTNHDYGFDVWAMHAGACYKPEGVEFFDSFCAGYDYATGGDNVGNVDTFIQLYPSVHGWFGIMDFFSWTNIQHWMIGANFDLHDGTLAVSYHWNRLASSDAGFVGYNQAGGASTDGRDLGREIDVVYSVQCTQSTVVDLGIGYFFPGDGFESSLGGGGDDNVTFGYLQFTTRL